MTARIPRLGSSTISGTKQRSQPAVGCVYLITSPSGKQYVGQTVRSLEERWKQHCSDGRRGSNLIFHNALRKYGADAFALEVLLHSDDKQELFAREIDEIAKRGTLSPGGYNMTTGGEGAEMGPEAKEKLSESVRAAHARPEVKQKYSDAAKRVWADSESRERRLEVLSVAWARPEVKQKRLQSFKATISKPEHREKCSRTSKEVNSRHEVKEKQSQARKSRWEEPGYAARVTLNIRKSRRKHLPSVFIEGRVFSCIPEASEKLGVLQDTIRGRCRANSRRFNWWHTIPNHNDPECDAVEECWAIMQWAEANPDHESVPAWVRRRA